MSNIYAHAVPSVKEMHLMFQAEEKKKFSLFGGKTSPGKLVTIPDHRQAEVSAWSVSCLHTSVLY